MSVTNRRSVLLAAGTALAAAAVADASPAASKALRGTVEYEGGKPIPEGQLEITVEDPAASAKARTLPAASVPSDGTETAITFDVPAGPEGREVVAVLERADGWLLARGSAIVTAGDAVTVTLYTVMY